MTVEEIAAAIAALSQEERERLINLLATQGLLPAGAHSHMPPTSAGQSSLGLSFREPSLEEEADYILVFDGGSLGNPGPGYGSYALIRRDGKSQVVRLDLGEEMTNNEAEYDTLIAGLEDLIGRIERAGRNPAEFTVEVRGDSKLVLNQVQGTWKAKEPRLRERRNRVRNLLSRFRAYALRLQPRQESVKVLGH